MDAPDITSLRKSFEAASTYSEYCTIAVTLGVFAEFVALFVFSKEMPKSEKIVMALATLTIVLGCGGEFIFGSRASDAATKLQQESDERIARLTRETESARAAIAEARKETENTKEAIAKANERTALALGEQEKLRAKNLAIENAIGERKLDPTMPLDNLREIVGVKFQIISSPSGEAIQLARQIANTLQEAGWTVADGPPEGPNIFPTPRMFDGVHVNFGLKENEDLGLMNVPGFPHRPPVEAAMQLVRYLTDNHIQAALGQRDLSVWPDGIKILVGPKPMDELAQEQLMLHEHPFVFDPLPPRWITPRPK